MPDDGFHNLLNEKMLCAVTHGGGTLGVRIDIGGRDLPHCLRGKHLDEADPEVYRLMQLADEARDAVMAQLQFLKLREDPEVQQQIKDFRTSLFELFGGNAIFVEEIPNGYSTQPYHRIRPEYVVTSRIGRVKIGQRSSVVEISWEDSIVTKTAEQLFPKDKVTKDGRMIHAHTGPDARRYVATLLDPRSI